MDKNDTQRSGFAWTAAEENKLLELFRNGETIQTMALAHSRTRNAIASKLCDLGVIINIPSKRGYYILGERFADWRDVK